jgi:hypothetical protein
MDLYNLFKRRNELKIRSNLNSIYSKFPDFDNCDLEVSPDQTGIPSLDALIDEANNIVNIVNNFQEKLDNEIVRIKKDIENQINEIGEEIISTIGTSILRVITVQFNELSIDLVIKLREQIQLRSNFIVESPSNKKYIKFVVDNDLYSELHSERLFSGLAYKENSPLSSENILRTPSHIIELLQLKK